MLVLATVPIILGFSIKLSEQEFYSNLDLSFVRINCPCPVLININVDHLEHLLSLFQVTIHFPQSSFLARNWLKGDLLTIIKIHSDSTLHFKTQR